MFAINNNLGLLPRNFFPEGNEKDYKPSPYLELLQEHRKDFTVFSGVSYPNVDGGHPADVCFITAAPHPGSGSFRNTISLDQVVADSLGTLTRFPSLTLAVNTRSWSLSFTGSGVAIPPSCTQVLWRRKGVLEELDQPGPRQRKVFADPGGAEGS